MSGGQADQTLDDAGPEADLDTQYGFGLSFPTPGTFYSTGGSPPFNLDANTPTDTNEPYDDVRSISPWPFFFNSADVLMLARSGFVLLVVTVYVSTA
jgi:hypothetical protein